VIDIEDIIKEVAKRTQVDKEVVSTICKHPFLQTVGIMKDDNNIQDILFNQLFKFKLKRRYKENKTNKYTTK
jgi:hypothetical protein